MIDVKDFCKSHVISDYIAEQSQTISFKIDGAAYCMSPFYEGSGMATNFPAGFRVFVKPVGEDEYQELFRYYDYINNYITDRYSRANYSIYHEVKEKYPDVKPNEYTPYIIYRMVTECFLQNVTLPYWSFLKQIYSEVSKKESSVDEIRECVHIYTEALKSSHSWMSLSNDEWVLFKLIVEHFIRFATEKQNVQYLENMSALLDFIQTRTANDFRDMIKSYPDMPQDNLDKTWFNNAVHGLKMETALWIRNNKDNNIIIDDSVLIDRQRLLELFASKLGIHLHATRLIGYDEDQELLHYVASQDKGFNGQTNIKPTIDETRSQISASFYGKDVDFVNTDSTDKNVIRFVTPYKEEGYPYRFNAHVVYGRYNGIGKDDIIRDRVTISLVPKYLELNEERVCWITKEVLQNGFNIVTCNRDLNPEMPYDSGWMFFGKNQSDEYVNNPGNVIMVDLYAFLELCPDAERLMEDFNNESHYQVKEAILSNKSGRENVHTEEIMTFPMTNE